MARKKQRQDIIGYLFVVLVFWALGIGLLAYGRLDGIAILLLAIFMTVIIPPVRRTITSLAKVLVKETTSVSQKAGRPTGLASRIVYLLEEWSPVKRFSDENPAEAAASEYLNHYFSNRVKFQKYHDEFRSDLEIDDVGIEIKVLWEIAELTRLRGQIMLYCKHFNHVIALIFNYNNIDLGSFVSDMRAHYPNKVTVITKE
jgi:hypothetical protein